MGILNGLEDFFFFKIKVIADFEFEENTYKNVTQWNNDSILTPGNWEQHKDTFFQQRMETYEDDYTLAEKVVFEFQELEKLPINKKAYQALKDRYSYYLKEALPPQPIAKQKETLSGLITNKNSVEIIESVKIKYKNIKGKRLKLLLLAFQDLGLIPKERNAKKFNDYCRNEFDWDIATYNAMNGYHYNEHIDSNEFNSIKQFIEPLTKTN